MYRFTTSLLSVLSVLSSKNATVNLSRSNSKESMRLIKTVRPLTSLYEKKKNKIYIYLHILFQNYMVS